MIIVQPNQNFGFNYTYYGQSPDLNVAFNIYDASGSGVPIFLEQIESVYAGFGAYVGTYPSELGIKYLVAGVVYTDNTFTTVDTGYAPFSEVYQAFDGTVLSLGFTYTTYDFSSNLPIRAMIYNTTTGSPVLQTYIDLVYVDFGIYFGAFEGAIDENFQIIGVVYEDDTFTTPNYAYAPSSSSFECISPADPDPVVSNSTQLDVSELMVDPDFVDGMSLITRTATVNAQGENVMTETTLNSVGSVQPASGKSLQRLPEALRLADVSSFWFRGVIVATAAGKYSSILVFKGRRYQVQNVMDWSTWGRGWTEGLCVAELPS